MVWYPHVSQANVNVFSYFQYHEWTNRLPLLAGWLARADWYRLHSFTRDLFSLSFSVYFSFCTYNRSFLSSHETTLTNKTVSRVFVVVGVRSDIATTADSYCSCQLFCQCRWQSNIAWCLATVLLISVAIQHIFMYICLIYLNLAIVGRSVISLCIWIYPLPFGSTDDKFHK